MSSREVINLSDRESLSPVRRGAYNAPAVRSRPGRDRTRRTSSRLAETINVDSSPASHRNHTQSNDLDRINRQRVRRRGRPVKYDDVEVIDLDSDTSPSTTPKLELANTPGKRRKFNSISSRESDVEIIQVFSPAAAARTTLQSACAAAASSLLSRKRPPEKTAIERIREVFPTLSRSKVQSLLDMAEKYSREDDDLVQIVMTVLADDPSGESINERVFAAAAVGGRIDPEENVESTAGQKVAELECNCCYCEYEFEQMISCKSGHIFCKTCLQKHVETRVFGLGNFGVDSSKGKKKAMEILCMHSDGCHAGFHEGHLRRALSEKVMKKYDELQYQAVVEGFKDTSKCPKCDYIAFTEENASSFHCPQCNFKSCRECGEEAHPGIKCDEVETKHETSGRNKVEEAMTNAVIRKCPRPFCRKPFMKTDGCNKITCSCGAFICYICRKEIPKQVAYKHFCQTPHCNHQSCNKCGLYADAESADKEAMKKAAKDAAKSVSTGRKGVNVDVDALLKNPQPDPSGQNGRTNNRHRNIRQHNPRPAVMAAPYQPQHHIPQQQFAPPQQHFQPPQQQHAHFANQFLPNQLPPHLRYPYGNGGHRHNRNHRR